MRGGRGPDLAAAVSERMSTRPNWLNAAFGLHDDSSREDVLRAIALLDRTPVELPLPNCEPARSREAFRWRAAGNGRFIDSSAFDPMRLTPEYAARPIATGRRSSIG